MRRIPITSDTNRLIRTSPGLGTLSETKTALFGIDRMRAVCLLLYFLLFWQQRKGFSNCTSGTEELEFRMREALHLSVMSRTTTQNHKPSTRCRSTDSRSFR